MCSIKVFLHNSTFSLTPPPPPPPIPPKTAIKMLTNDIPASHVRQAKFTASTIRLTVRTKQMSETAASPFNTQHSTMPVAGVSREKTDNCSTTCGNSQTYRTLFHDRTTVIWNHVPLLTSSAPAFTSVKIWNYTQLSVWKVNLPIRTLSKEDQLKCTTIIIELCTTNIFYNCMILACLCRSELKLKTTKTPQTCGWNTHKVELPKRFMLFYPNNRKT